MKQIEKYILNQDSDYAIFLNGLWGKGKTYYIENTLTQWLAKQTPKRHLFYFSVNGIKDTNELHDLIITDVAKKYFEEKSEGFRKKVTETIGEWKIFKKAKDNEKKFIKLINLVNSVKKAKSIFKFSDMYKPDQVLIVIDDLERISPNYNYEELFGYINNHFVEHGNYKILLIGDSSKDSIKKSDFDKIKEKYIRWSFDFQNDLSTVLPALFKKYESDKEYQVHLNEHLEYILSLLDGFEIENLRTVKYFLEVYSEIYNCTSPSHEYIYKDLIYFTLITAFEARKGSFKIFNNLKELPDIIFPKDEIVSRLIYNAGTNRTEEPPKYKTEFPKIEQSVIDSYQSYSFNRLTMFTENNVKYKFFKPIYLFIKSGILNEEELKTELLEYSKLKKPVTKYETNKYLDSITSFRTINEKELDSAVDNLKQDIENGNIDLGEFIRAGNFLSFLGEEKLLTTSLAEINTFLLDNLSKVKIDGNITGLYHHFDFEMSRIEKNNPQLATELKNKIEESNAIRYTNRSNKYLKEWNPKGEDAYSEFQGIMECISSEEIYKKVISKIKDRDFVEGVTKQFEEHYRSINAGEHYSGHLTKLNEIKNKIENHNPDNLDRIDKWYIKKIEQKLAKSIEHIGNTA